MLDVVVGDFVGKATDGVDCQALQGHPSQTIDLLDVLCISKRMADASAGSVTYNYTYDANGNMLAGAGRTLTYTAYNKPNTITANGATTMFTYDADYQRVKKSVNVAGAVTNYFTIGDLYEKIVKPTGGTEHRYTIHAAGRVVAQVSKVGTTFTTQYVHTDLLGSIDALTEKSGTSYTVAESKSFSEFGAPRLNTWAKGNPPFDKTTLGYTGHEMDTESGLIDMNARLYDPQNLNRYSYVLNNPFGYTDPTGHVAIPQPDGSVYVEEWDLTIAGNGSGMATLGNAGITFGTTFGAFQSGLLPSTAYANGVGLEVGNPFSIAQQQASYAQMTHVPWSPNVNSGDVWKGLAAAALPVAAIVCAVAEPCGALALAALDLSFAANGDGVPFLGGGAAVANSAGSIRNVNVIGSKMNCVNCVVATDATLAGRPASALPGGPYRIDVIEKFYGSSFGVPGPISSVSEALSVAGSGSRGIVFGSRGSEVGHVFNAVNQNGVIRFLDGQTGGAASLDGFQSFQFMRTN